MKYLDEKGIQHLWSKLSLEDYPNNEVLMAVLNAIDETKADKNTIPLKVSQLENDSNFTTEEEVESLFKRLQSDTVLRFYCIEDVVINLNGVLTTYPANSNVEIKFVESDVWELIPTSNNSILALNGFPGALGTYYPWLEGVKQFSNILFDMNPVDMYSKWSQGNQGSYQVQYAQYINCIFWSDNAYVSDVSKRTNYTLYYTSQLPLCYSSIPDNTFKAFYLAFNVNSDPNWGNKVYRDSFAKATWATQVFSYYGARTVGIFGHDDPDFNIVLPKDCRGLMYAATAIENAGTFDAINVTNFGAKSGSWREAFGECSSLRNLYIKNLKVNLNISWSPINYDSINFIISKAVNANKITITVSPYTYNLLSVADFELAASKNITIALLTTNYHEDLRLGEIANKANITYVDEKVANLVNSAPETLNTIGEIAIALQENEEVVQALNTAIAVKADKTYVDEAIANIPPSEASQNALLKTEQELTAQDQSQVRKNLKLIGKDLEGQGFTVEGQTIVANPNAEVLGDYVNNIAIGQHSLAEGNGTITKGTASHAEGSYSKALNDSCHSEGYQTTAAGYYAHAEGELSRALAYASHAEGMSTTANGRGAHVEGIYTVASGEAQHAEGIANIEDTENKYIHISGNGTLPTDRSNAYTLDWNGNAWFSGDVYTSSTSGLNKDEGSKKLATEEYVNIRVPVWTEEDEGKVLKIVNGIPTWML